MTLAAPVARNYFAIRATGDLSVVLISGDDFADLVERRRILESITGGVKLAIVWGLDGAPVTRAQAERLLNPEEYEVSIERLVDSDVVVDGKTRKESRTVVSTEKRTRPRADPRSIRPEVRPGCPPARRELPPLVDEFGWRIDGQPVNTSAKRQQSCCIPCVGMFTRGVHATTACGDPLTDPDPPLHGAPDAGRATPPARDAGAAHIQPAARNARRTDHVQIPVDGVRAGDRGVRGDDGGHQDARGRPRQARRDLGESARPDQAAPARTVDPRGDAGAVQRDGHGGRDEMAPRTRAPAVDHVADVRPVRGGEAGPVLAPPRERSAGDVH